MSKENSLNKQYSQKENWILPLEEILRLAEMSLCTPDILMRVEYFIFLVSTISQDM